MAKNEISARVVASEAENFAMGGGGLMTNTELKKFAADVATWGQKYPSVRDASSKFSTAVRNYIKNDSQHNRRKVIAAGRALEQPFRQLGNVTMMLNG